MLFFLLFLLSITPLFAQDYYVDINSGDDGNDGLSLVMAWQNIQKAAETLQAGDTVYIKGGLYQINTHATSQEIAPVNSGNAVDGYITFMAYADETPVLDGGNAVLSHEGLVYIANKQYIKINGLTVQNIDDNAEGIGIYVENSQNIIIENNHVIHTDSSGIQVFTKSAKPGSTSSNIFILNNEVEDTNRGGPNEMITIAGVEDFEVAYNTVHNRTVGDIGGEGIDVKQASMNGSVHHNTIYDLNTNRSGIYIDAWDVFTHDIEVYSNIIYDIDTHGIYIGSEQGGLLQNINVYHNLIYNNYRAAIILADESSHAGSEPLDNINIFNNTMVNNGATINWYGSITLENPYISNIYIANNISYLNGGYQISAIPSGASNVTIQNNLLFGDLGTADENRISAGDDIEADAIFTNYDIQDFSLQNSSPAIDAGDNTIVSGIATDYAGNPRSVDGNSDSIVSVDIGAYEYQTTATDTDGDGIADSMDPNPNASSDFDGDGDNDVDDLNIIYANYGATTSSLVGSAQNADMDNDGTIDYDDIWLWYGEYLAQL